MAIRITNNNYGGRVSISSRGLGGRFQYIADPVTVQLLLDSYASATVAYSLRKLRTAYSGAAIRVRRSSDNTETDIGFVNNALDTASLLSFCGAGNGFVTKWYDQSGNSRDAVQATTANQPTIVSSGVIQTKNSKPSVLFTSTSSNHLSLSQTFTGTAGTLINLSATLIDPVTNENAAPLGNVGSANEAVHQPWIDGNIYESFATTVRKNIGNPVNNTTNLYLYNVISAANLYNIKINNTTFYNTATNTVGYNTVANYAIGRSLYIGFIYYFSGYVSEILCYTSNQNENISGINANINSYYSVYQEVPTGIWQGTGTALLDTYPNASVAFSLRNLSSAYLGPLINVRNSIDNTERDIYGDPSGNLNTGSLLSFIGLGTGYIKTWYDQSGNGNHAIQSTQNSQPIIVNAGSIVVKGSKPTIAFSTYSIPLTSPIKSGSSGTLINLSATLTDPPGSNPAPLGGVGSSTENTHQPWNDGVIYETFATTTRKTVGNPTNNTTNLYLYNAISDVNLYNVKINNTTFFNTTTNTVGYSTNIPSIASQGGYTFGGYISEIITYNTNQTASISGINTNINSYYTIY